MEKLDAVSLFIAEYLHWVRQAGVWATFLPITSYRGHDREDWLLLPSLCRLRAPERTLEQYERETIREFRSQFDLVDWTDIEVLAYARHHGAPTRLLDWSRNPLIGLWFAVADGRYDSFNGAVFQLRFPQNTKLICLSHTPASITSKCKHPIHVFASPARVDRTHRQQSVFSMATFDDGYALKPLEQVGEPTSRLTIRKFTIPATLKPEIRPLLPEIGLDPYSIYGDPDSLGKAVAARLGLAT